MKSLSFLQEHCEFSNNYSCYVLLAVSRKKDSPEITNSQEIVFREVIKRHSDIVRKYNKIKAQITNYRDENDKSFPFYLYVSLNPRDAKKASFSLMKKMLGWVEEENNGADHSRMFKKVYGHFYSELMTTTCRAKNPRYFMIDYDEKDGIKNFLVKLNKLGIVTRTVRETRNGYHVLTDPFDRRLSNRWKSVFPAEVKVDANFFVEYVGVKE